jgi:hypothetical protein
MRLVVAPRVGAWIETTPRQHLPVSRLVAPRVGAWIETSALKAWALVLARRSPCGGVD